MLQPPVTPPATVADFKAQFIRGFRYSTGPDGVTDGDISLGITMALSVWNPVLWTKTEAKAAFLLAVAHFVVTNIQAAGGLQATPAQGPDGPVVDATQNTGGGVIGSKTEGKMSQTYAGLDALIERYPTLADFRRTDFGAQYALLVAPRLRCRVGLATNEGAPDAVIPAVPFLA